LAEGERGVLANHLQAEIARRKSGSAAFARRTPGAGIREIGLLTDLRHLPFQSAYASAPSGIAQRSR